MSDVDKTLAAAHEKAVLTALDEFHDRFRDLRPLGPTAAFIEGFNSAYRTAYEAGVAAEREKAEKAIQAAGMRLPLGLHKGYKLTIERIQEGLK
jgi:hypothetical protein